jgi:hypothetical protein
MGGSRESLGAGEQRWSRVVVRAGVILALLGASAIGPAAVAFHGPSGCPTMNGDGGETPSAAQITATISTQRAVTTSSKQETGVTGLWAGPVRTFSLATP